ncbi:MAG TPA: peptide chain release factor N(5)-glutamine methyltransferase [Planctomycetota bacterium]|jgi:release factor glutamine methyltransferase
MNSKIQPVQPPAPPQPRIWTSLDLIKWTTEFFGKKGIDSPRLEAELLLAEVLECPRIRLYVDFEKPVAAEKLAKFREFVKRRGETREPQQYIVGHGQFHDLKLKLSPAVLIPRPETELLGQWALEKLKALPGEALRALDLCTGSGCIALYLAAKDPRAKVDATDISPEALAIAAENARALKVDERVAFHPGDLFAALPAEMAGSFDLLVSNPPYIDPALKDTLQPEVREHEPAQALFAPDAGTAVLRRIIDSGAQWLKPGGWIALEFGQGQASVLEGLAKAANWQNIDVRHDDAKLPRFLVAQRA